METGKVGLTILFQLMPSFGLDAAKPTDDRHGSRPNVEWVVSSLFQSFRTTLRHILGIRKWY